MDELPQVAARGAVEALRAGVPNRAAIRLLGEHNGALVNPFLDSLGRCAQGLEVGRQSEGTFVWGGFGSGKSHLLGYMRELALQRNFVVSVVPVSKETPMFDPARLYAAVVRAAEVQGANDDLMTVALSRLKPNTAPFERLEAWATQEAGAGSLSAIFPALLWLIPRLGLDDHARIARFFGGGKLSATVVRSWLRQQGAAKLFDIKPTRRGGAGAPTAAICAATVGLGGSRRMVRSPRRSRTHRPLFAAATRQELRRAGPLAGPRRGGRVARHRRPWPRSPTITSAKCSTVGATTSSFRRRWNGRG